MLGFKEYRNRLTEAAPEVEAGVQPGDVLKHEKAANIQQQVNQIVDAWVTDLKRTLINPMTPLSQRRGVWDRFKNTMSNMWHGRYNQSNPYFWKNKLGDDLGATQEESFNPNNLSLADYKSLRDICESLEAQLNEDVPAGAENLRLVRMIDTKAQELKQKLMSIVGGVEDGSPMSATPSAPSIPSTDEPEAKPNEPAAEPASAAVPPQEEEQDSKVPGGFLSLVKVVEQWAKSKKMDMKTAQDLIDRLTSKRDSIRQKAADDFTNFNKQFNGDEPEKAPASAAATPDATPASDKGALFTPPSSGKRWDELNPDEKAKWDIYGGGASHGSGTKVDGCLNDHGIFKMPWIMRIGDPRRNILAAQKEGKLPDSKKCGNKKVGSHWFDFLHRLGRWELDSDPIKDAMDLQSRIEKAKSTTEEARRKMPRSTAPSEIDAARDAAMSGNEPEAPKAPMSTPTPTPTPEPAKPSLRDRVGSIGSEVPEVAKFTGDGSGLSEPMHKNEKPDLKTRVGGMDGADAISNPTPKEEPKEKPVRQMKNELKARIEALSDEDTRVQLLRTLKTVKDRADLADLERDIGVHELANIEIEWTATDVKNFYKQRLHERKGVPEPLVEHKKIEMLSFTERTQYFKEQLQKR